MQALLGATNKLSNRVIKALSELFHPASNSIYKARTFATVLVNMALAKTSAEEYSEPSPDRILDRLKEIDEHGFNRTVFELNTVLLEQLPLPQKVTIAMDFKTIPYWGAEQPSLVSDSRLPGTKLGMRFATLSIVEFGRIFTLRVKQVGPFTPKVSILRENLGYIEGLVEPKIILLDRGFFSVEVITELQSRKLPFLMPAKRTSPIKKLCNAFEKGGSPLVKHTIRSSRGSVEVKVIFVKKKTEDGWRTFAFVSNIAFRSELASEIYRSRWRIETNNREIKKFQAKTTSTNMKLRRIYYALAALLYNLWIALRQVLAGLRSREFKNILRIFSENASSMHIQLGPGPPA